MSNFNSQTLAAIVTEYRATVEPLAVKGDKKATNHALMRLMKRWGDEAVKAAIDWLDTDFKLKGY